MIIIGAFLLVIAVVFIVFGLALQAAQVLLWIGVGLIVVGAGVLIYERFSRRKLP